MSNSFSVIVVLAWRNLWRNYRRTLILLVTIALGVWSMIFMTALMRGMVDEIVRNGLATLPGEVQIHAPAYRDDPSIVHRIPMPSGDLLAALGQPPIVGWSARIRVPAVIASERDSRGVTLLGVDPLAEQRLGSAPHAIVEGRFLTDENDKGVVIGASMARRLETRLGKRIVLMSQDPNNDVADRGARVVGIYTARLPGTEDRFVYSGRSVIQSMLGIEGEVSEIAITAGDYRAVAQWYPAIAAAGGAQFEVLPWTELDSYLSTMLNVQDGFALVFMIVVFLALSFGLVNTLVMSVFERVREIGLMQALGMRPKLILAQVLLESVYLLLVGLAMGNIIAFATIKSLEDGIDISGVAQGMEQMSMSPVLYPALRIEDMVMSTMVVIVLGLLASLLPAWKASQLDPVVALAKT
ncbi:MAG: ABC-type lipoprotein release transport system permease subunit [Halioglobus sp.]|jgi:ABC-type lipoprotein release transport system permease subunit